MTSMPPRRGLAAIALVIAAVLLAFVLTLSLGLGFLAAIAILQIAIQAATAVNFYLLAPRTSSGVRLKSHEPFGFWTFEITIISGAFALTGIASLAGLLHSGNLAGWLAIGAAAAGSVNVVATRRSDMAPSPSAPAVRTSRDRGRPTAQLGGRQGEATALIRVRRASGGYTEHLHPFDVVIDDEMVGRLDPGASGTFEVAPGSHKVVVEIDWCRSEQADIQLGENEIVTFRCETRANLLTDAYWATFGRHRYLRLAQEHSEVAQ